MAVALLYKLAGAGILLLASFIYGSCKVREGRRRLRETEAFLELVEYVTEGIEHGMKPLPEIFAEYGNGILEQNGFLQIVREKGIRQAWLTHENRFNPTKGKGIDQFSVFCREIGRSYRKEEMELCSLTKKRLEDELAAIRVDMKNREKMYRTIPPLMVMSLVLMLM